MSNNPYHFVPFPDLNEYQKYLIPLKQILKPKDEQRYKGKIQFALKPLSYFAIKSVFDEAENNKDSSGFAEIYIPGSSLRGMIRTVLEALGLGCGFMFQRDYEIKRECYNPATGNHDHLVIYKVLNCMFSDHKYAEIKKGESISNLSPYASCNLRLEEYLKVFREDERKEKALYFKICPVCSLFGFTSTISLASRLYFEDSKTVKVKLQQITLPRLETPRPYHTGFYFSNPSNWNVKRGEPAIKACKDGIYNGRKFYLHGRNKWYQSGNEVDVFVLSDLNIEFPFKIRFQNLNDFELGALLFALTMEEGICHKIGYGKPVGLGKVKIEVNEVKVLKKSDDRFDQIPYEHLDYNDLINRFLAQTNIKHSRPYQALKTIWNCEGTDINYPDLSWFRPANLIKTINEYNEQHGTGFSISQEVEKETKRKKPEGFETTATIIQKSKKKGFILFKYIDEKGIPQETRLDQIQKKHPQLWASVKEGESIKIFINSYGHIKIVED